MKTIRVIEWDSRRRRKNLALADPTIYPDVYQVLEWVVRQALLEKGFRIGFEKLAPTVRISQFPSTNEYVAAILAEIENYEQTRQNRFNAAQELYNYHQHEEIEQSEVKKLEADIGVTGQDSATWAGLLTVERPQNLLCYGFERMFYPLMSDRISVSSVFASLGNKRGTRLSPVQQRSLRRGQKGIGRYLVQLPNGNWRLEFSRSPFIREMIFAMVAVFRPFFFPNSGDPWTFPLNRFVSQRIGFMFRDDRDINSVNGILRRQLGSSVIRGRLKGNKGLLNDIERRLVVSKLVNPPLYRYLKKHNGQLRPGLKQYL